MGLSNSKPFFILFIEIIFLNERVIGYDNAEGKGDHRHYGKIEEPYEFKGIEKLLEDFYKDVEKYKGGKHES